MDFFCFRLNGFLPTFRRLSGQSVSSESLLNHGSCAFQIFFPFLFFKLYDRLWYFSLIIYSQAFNVALTLCLCAQTVFGKSAEFYRLFLPYASFFPMPTFLSVVLASYYFKMSFFQNRSRQMQISMIKVFAVFFSISVDYFAMLCLCFIASGAKFWFASVLKIF